MMFSRKTSVVWVGILMLSGMFLLGQDSWVNPPECVDNDGDGYGNPASTGCTYSALDCQDDPSGDAAVCGTCTCGEVECLGCARCINPGVSEALYSEPVCHDGHDNDCDGWVDQLDPFCNVCNDTDGDGFGDPASQGCIYSEWDCDDTDPDISPLGVEAPYEDPVCSDGDDNDCDGNVDGDDHGCTEPGDMVVIPGGCFSMGDAFTEGGVEERPVHTVCITGFDLDAHEVTNAEYSACVDDGYCDPPSNDASWTRTSYFGNPLFDNYPVIFVDWENASAYCDRIGKRLPTEAEWEYAARGGLADKRYPLGDSIDCDDANYARYFQGDDCEGYGSGANDTHAVESYSSNGYGLYDMAGNVSEWVNDYYLPDYYAVSPGQDPPGPDAGTSRARRGGSWYLSEYDVRVAARFSNLPTTNDMSIGFRCARGGASGY